MDGEACEVWQLPSAMVETSTSLTSTLLSSTVVLRAHPSFKRPSSRLLVQTRSAPMSTPTRPPSLVQDSALPS